MWCGKPAEREARTVTLAEPTSVLKLVPVEKRLGGLQLIEEAVAQPYPKGADSPEDSPSSWPPPGVW